MMKEKCEMYFPEKLDKSTGYAFTIDNPWLLHEVDFYRGFHGGYACEYNKDLIYVSNPLVRTSKNREEAAKIALKEYMVDLYTERNQKGI